MSTIDVNGFLEGGICNWIVDHRDRHATLFKAMGELNRECHRFLSGRKVDVTSELQITTSALFARMMELFQGTIIAVEHGMVAVGSIVFRGYLEAYFRLMAIHKDPKFLGEYLDQFQVERSRLVNRIRKSSAPCLAELRKSLDENLARDVSGTTKEKKIREVSIKEVANRAGLDVVYATAYTVLCGAVHTTPLDLESYCVYDDTRKAISAFKYGPTDRNTESLLAQAGLLMADALETISAIFGEDRVQLCARFEAQFQAVLGQCSGWKR